MHSISSLIVVLSLVALPTTSFASNGQEPKRFDPAFSDKQLIDLSQCEKVYEVQGMQLCKPLRSTKVHFWGEVIEGHRNDEKTERLGPMDH